MFDQSEIVADGAQTSRRGRSALSIEVTQGNISVENMLDQQLESPGKGKRKGRHPVGFGLEVTNGELEDVLEEEEEEDLSPVRKARRKGKVSADGGDDEWLPVAPKRNGEMAV